MGRQGQCKFNEWNERELKRVTVVTSTNGTKEQGTKSEDDGREEQEKSEHGELTL